MGLTGSLAAIAALIATSAFLSIAEISMAAARRLRLRQMADEGDARAERVLVVQQQPGNYFTVVQIGQNMVAILGGIVGEGALTPYFVSVLSYVMEPRTAETMGFLASFLAITSLFILFSDLFPKRLGMTEPERAAVRVVGPMRWWMTLLSPVVWVFNGLASLLFKLFGLPEQRDDRITPDDILAMAEAGTQAGVPAIRTLTGEGININVTLLFSLRSYEAVANAYIAGIEDLVAAGGEPAGIASVASFFVSRIDSAVDRMVDEKSATSGTPFVSGT